MSKHGEVVGKTQCPKCAKEGRDNSKDNLAVYETGYSKCFACDYYKYDQDTTNLNGRTKVSLPLVQQVQYHHGDPNRYITKDITEHYRAGFGNYIVDGVKQTVKVFTYGDKQKIKTQDKRFKWLGGSCPWTFFGQELYNGGKSLNITEGEEDAESVAKILGVNWPTVSLPNGSKGAEKTIKQNINWLNKFDKITLWMDNDEAGKEAMQVFMSYFPEKIKVVKYPGGFKDANQLLMADRGSDIKKMYWNSAEPSLENNGFITVGDMSYDDLYPEDLDFKGEDIDFMPGATEAMEGLRNEVIILSAGSGCGKSTLAQQISFGSMKNYDKRWGVILMEQPEDKTILAYNAMYHGVNMNKARKRSIRFTPEQIEQSQEFFGDRLVIMKDSIEYSLKGLMDKMELMAKSMDLDYILLDHVSFAVNGEQDERVAIDNLMKFCYKLNVKYGTGILAIVHLSNGNIDWGEGIVPKKKDLRGSGGLAQYAATIFTLSRDQSNDSASERLSTYVHGIKYREGGEYTGVCTDRLMYNPKLGTVESYEKFPKCPHKGAAQYTSVDEDADTEEYEDFVPFSRVNIKDAKEVI